MRECPKCNYVDPPYWRTPPFFSEVDLMRSVKEEVTRLYEKLNGVCPRCGRRLWQEARLEKQFEHGIPLRFFH